MTKLEGALSYAGRGWHVLPLHHVNPGGKCSCGNKDCKLIGKHPRIGEWPQHATMDTKQIKAWWRKWPRANIGIMTGTKSGICVLDVDPRNGGDRHEFETQHEILPETPHVVSGSRGTHDYFQCPDYLPSTKLGHGLDFLADGNHYVVAPPSNHVSGKLYEWDVSADIEDVPLAPLPQWLDKLVRENAKTAEIAAQDLPAVLPEVDVSTLKVSQKIKRIIADGEPVGKRSEAMFAAIAAMNRGGYSQAEIAAVMLDPANGISEKPWEQKNPKSPSYETQVRGWMAKEIARVIAKTKEKPKAQDKPDIPEMWRSPDSKQDMPAELEAMGEPNTYLTLDLSPNEIYKCIHANRPTIPDLMADASIEALSSLFGKAQYWSVIEQYLRDAKVAPENTRTLRATIQNYIEDQRARIVDLVEYADHLQDNLPEPVKHQHPGIMPLTGTIIFGGRPKMGKSYLALNLAIAISSGGKFASHFDMAYPGYVLYMALEDNRERMAKRMHALCGPEARWPKRLGHIYKSPTMDNGRLSREVGEWIESVEDARLIIIDIFSRVKPRSQRKNPYQEDYEVAAELTNLAMAYGVSILVVTHLNQSYSDVQNLADAIMDTTGTIGGMSTIWAMSYVGSDEIDAALFVTGKDVPTWTVALKQIDLLQDIDWKALGDLELLTQGEARNEVLEALYTWEGHAPKASELRKALDKTKQPFNRLLNRMKRDGLIKEEKNRLHATNLGIRVMQTFGADSEDDPFDGSNGSDGYVGSDGSDGSDFAQDTDNKAIDSKEPKNRIVPPEPWEPSPPTTRAYRGRVPKNDPTVDALTQIEGENRRGR